MIKDIKELEKLLKLCRKQGVTEIKLGDVEFKLGELPIIKAPQEATDEDDVFNGMTEDDIDEITGVSKMAFYSVGEQ